MAVAANKRRHEMTQRLNVSISEDKTAKFARKIAAIEQWLRSVVLSDLEIVCIQIYAL